MRSSIPIHICVLSLFVFMHVCDHTDVHRKETCTYMYVYTCLSIPKHTCVLVLLCIHIRLWPHYTKKRCVHIYIYIYVYTKKRSVHIWINTYISIPNWDMQIYIYIHTHLHQKETSTLYMYIYIYVYQKETCIDIYICTYIYVYQKETYI